tara:strand:+ start:1242 stop:1652 length:411 start_codon:yes stop_codon:yes gene_type:complete
MKSGTKTCRVGTVEVTHNGKRRGRKKMLTPEELSGKAEEYISSCTEESRPTRVGLFRFMGFKTKQSFFDYMKDPEYKDVLEEALFLIEGQYEQQLANGRGDGGLVFALKQYGWADKQEVLNKNVDVTHEQWLDSLE